jgi:flagellar motility protein MotE (MotC chaperone)
VKKALFVSLSALLLGGIAATAIGAPGGSSTSSIRSEQARGAEAIMDLLEQKERGLQRREATLEAREADLRAAESEVQTRLTELEQVRGEIRGLLTDLDERQQVRVTALVKMMESMRDKQCAMILNETENVVALAVLLKMNVAKAGKAMAKMDPARAAFFADQLGKPPLAKGSP